MTQNQKLSLPSGQQSFGQIPEIVSKGILIPEGSIFLKVGKHFGPNRGFGATHIWAEHSKEMARAGFESFEDVPKYVNQIIRTGSAIHCEFAQLKGYNRLTILRNASGTAILEYKGQYPNGHYSIVTAFSGNKKHGPKVGTVL